MASTQARRWRGRVAKALFEAKQRGCKAVFTLIDPDKRLALRQPVLEALQNSTLVLIGGSSGVTPYDVDEVILELRSQGVNTPFVIFPGGLNNIGREADAILYMSLLNTLDVYWAVGAQVLAAPIIAKLGIEPLPAAYVIVGEGGAAGHVGKAHPVPPDKPELVAAYVLAARFMGKRFVYLEAGSGARTHIPVETVSAAKHAAGDNVYLIVGGGIRDERTARALLDAGADAIVIGTLLEKQPEKAAELVKSIKPCNLVRLS